MIQSTYTSVSNADIVPCGKKGQIIKSDPIPLLRNNYLGEYRTELEKAKVRKNLGIADEYSLQWGNISGFVESQEDLINYIESKWEYTNDISEDINTVSEALDYVIYFVSNFKSDNESIINIKGEIVQIKKLIDSTKALLSTDISSVASNVGILFTSISEINDQINTINDQIEILNESLKKINVDANILAWIKSSLKDSNTIEIVESNVIEAKISQEADNAVQINQGIYVKDYSKEISKITTLEKGIKENSDAIQESINLIQGVDEYQTNLSDDTTVPNSVGGIDKGTTVSELKGKTLSEIIDVLLFPSYVRPLVYPQFYYTPVNSLVKVGSIIERPELVFIQGDAGNELERTDLLFDPNDQEVISNTYDFLGTYTYKGTLHHAKGEELLNNKNELSGKYVPENILESNFQVTTTYPLYVSFSESGESKIEQPLIKFGQSSEIQVSLQGRAQIWIPGLNSRLESFTVNVGLGEYLNVDLNGWDTAVVSYNGIDYKVWTKKDSYASLLSHKIKVTLAL